MAPHQVAAMQISKYAIKKEAAQYAHATGHEEELDEQMIDVIIMYINSDKIKIKDNEMTRLQFFHTIAEMIPDGYNIHSTTTTAQTTTSIQIPTTWHTRTKRAPVGPLAALGISLGATAAVNAVSSSITGDAPFSWGGKTVVHYSALQHPTKKTSGSCKELVKQWTI